MCEWKVVLLLEPAGSRHQPLEHMGVFSFQSPEWTWSVFLKPATEGHWGEGGE